MSFRWLKHYMPRSLYGRAALILVVPVVVLQLVVSVVFIGNHLEDTTTQMTLTMVRELELIRDQAASASDPDSALSDTRDILDTLKMDVGFVDPETVPDQDLIHWFDYSGRVVRDTIRANVPGTLSVQLPDNNMVHLFFESRLGPVSVEFNRRRVTAAAPHQLLVTMIFFGIVMTLISYVYMRNQLRPITRLARAAQAFGRGRNEPYTPRGAQEVRAAGGAFLDMRARIERQIEQRTMMLSGVSHDLRTPLTRLKLGLSLLDEEDAEPLLRDVDEMQRLLDAFLDFSKGAAEGEMKKTDPVALIGQVVEDAQRSGTPVKLVQTEGEGAASLNPGAIRRAVENLIGNAVRYGERAEVSVVRTDKFLRIRVEDDGPGIPADQRAQAVQPFARLDPARNQNLGTGVGLGLAIVADIARAHGGALRLGDSEHMGGLCADIVIGL